ncbi:17201_t:CDS:2, partial [Dentiscutata erythropus]
VSRTTLTDEQRLEVIKHRNENSNETHDDTVKWIKNTYNLDIHRTTIGRLLKRKNDIKEGSSSKRIKPVQHKELDHLLNLSVDQFKFLVGWLDKFKKRYGISKIKCHGEVASADHNAADTAIPRLKILLAQYNLQDIYNMDETIILNLILHWLQQIQDFDQKMTECNVILLIDNAESYKFDGITLRNMKLHFFPPKTTSKIQPLDAGFIVNAWHNISSTTIKNCFNHTKILPEILESEINEGIGVNTENSFTTTNELSDLELQITKEVDEFLEQNMTNMLPTDQEIIDLASKEVINQKPVDSNNEEPEVTKKEALNALDTLSLYLL